MDLQRDLELRKFVAPEFIFGVGALKLAGRYAKNFGASRILIVTDPGVMAAGWTDRVIENLELEDLPYVIFAGVTPNPRAEEVMRGAEVYKSAGCNLILAVGGGSPIDCAKGIGIVSTNKKHILEFEGVDQVSVPMPPLICIPTTGGTSADVSQFAIISNIHRKIKIAIISKAVVPDVALIDPVTLTTMDPYLAACTGIDALVHAIEAYVSLAHSPITDLHALAAIRLLSANLLPSLADPDNLHLRSQVMLGSLEAGLAFSNASLGAVHAMAHSLGGLLDLPHGECNAILLEHVMSFNFPEVSERFLHIGKAMGLALAKKSITEKKAAILAEVTRLRKAVGIEQSLGQKGVHRTDVPELSQKAINDPCIVTNPRRPGQRDIEVIFEEAI
ncbi:MAG: iron-containing alcohol dehydrogenase [Syntrophales bacterium]|nr:iron-containing alcohol dehydrogenase [Syntrophales bacterium]MDD5641752.1 iron-containing alcohol dehydrogenase [Syntrophales bacterium]